MSLPLEASDQVLRRRVLTAAAFYFALHFLLRILVSGSVELDEAEQVLLTQHLAWGYGSQPPLYTWLQAGLFHLFGPGVLSLALLKNALLLCLYLFTFLAAREMAGEDLPAVAAMASLLFIPQIAWESQRDLTHSVLATAMAAATLYAAARLGRRGRGRDYLLFGFFAGLGILGKYNFAVFLAALLVAGVSLPDYRRHLLSPRIFLALLVFALVTGPHLAWVVTNTGHVLRQADAFHAGALPTVVLDHLRGGAALARAMVAFLAPLGLIYLLLLCRRPAPPREEASPFPAVLGRTLLCGVLICVALVLVFRVTSFKDRWMQPILFAAAIYLPLRFRQRLGARGLRRVLAVAAAVAVLILALLPARTLLASRLQGRNQLNAPFDRLSEDLRAAGFEGGNIAAGNRWVGGNLRLRFPESRVFVPELPGPVPRAGAPWLLVWDASRHDEMPAALRQLATELPALRTDHPPRVIEAPSLHGDGSMRLAFVQGQAKGH
jgi:4-amino-4-deoxy-L-arabinose transferase-like glycosyltransferase